MVRSIGPRVHRKGSLYPKCAVERRPSRPRSQHKTNADPKSCHSIYGFAVIKTPLRPPTKSRRKRKTPPSASKNIFSNERVTTFDDNKTREGRTESSKSSEALKLIELPMSLAGQSAAEQASGIITSTPIMNYNNPVTFVGVEQVQYSFVQMNHESSHWAMPTLSYTDESYETQKTPLKYGARDGYLTDWRDRDRFSPDFDEDWRSPIY